MVEKIANKRILILGGNGFVGRNVSEAFDEVGIPYTTASRTTGVDLRDTKQTIKLLEKERPDFIINCAAHVGSLNYVTKQAATVISDNLKMIIALYEAVASTSPNAIVINPIANCAYPGKATFYKEEEWLDGALHSSVFAYGSTRRMLWSVGESYFMQFGIKSIYLLVPNMYGPYDSTDPNKAHALNALVSKFVKAQKTNQDTLTIWGTGIAVREWLYAKDFGRILVHVLKDPFNPAFSKPINIAQNFGLSVKELVDIITSHFTYNGEIAWDSSMPDGAPKKVMDDAKFRSIFPDFRFTDLGKGISETIKYYESVYPY